MDERLISAATAHDGYFTRTEALDCGYHDRDIAAAIRTEEWSRVRPGAYASRATWAPLSAEHKHRVRTYSVLDKLGDVVEVDGRLCMRPARAAWEAATITSARGGLVVIDSALHLQKMTAGDLAKAAVDFDKWAGSRRVDVVARLADPGAETAGESLTRYLCYEQGLPRPTLQYLVHDESGDVIARTDLAWEEYAHVGEFDGAVKYTRGLGSGEDATTVVVREKRREDKVRRQHLGMSRVVWVDVMPERARATGITLWRDLEQSRSLYRRNRVLIGL